jgi:CRISPR/Cas system CSM-associated protein Csm3 (group 7 of RAMP superfamily)
MENKYRFLVKIIIEAKSPLNIGSGNKGIKSDSLVLRDVNGLPFIPGTTIAGLLRHTLSKDEERLMGSQEMGSLLIITEAKMLDCDGTVLDGILSQETLNSEFLQNFRQLPIRQHAKIGHRGATVKSGKFDEEIVLKGTRFCFEMEMLSAEAGDAAFRQLLNTLMSDTFRIGSGSRSGFGEIDVVGHQCQYKMIDLTIKEQREWYLKKSSSLSEEWKDADILKLQKPKIKEWTTYEIGLKPADFLLFGSGFGNDKADMTFVRETFIDWSGECAQVKDRERVVLIPASSVKGALSHRTAFHYNRLTQVFADALNDEERMKYVGKNNTAVKALFGSEVEPTDGKLQNKKRGNVLMSDIIEEVPLSTKVLNHVSIDRFTGGAIDGALFNEEILFAKGHTFILNLLVNNAAFKDNDLVKTAFEDTLKDLCSGMLPLGGGVNRGNGCFEGTIKRDGELIYENN